MSVSVYGCPPLPCSQGAWGQGGSYWSQLSLTVQGTLLSLDLASDWMSEGDGGRATGLDVIPVDLHPEQYLNLCFVMMRS